MKSILITGSGGLVGSEAVRFYCDAGYAVTGIDNDFRKFFFGEEASTSKITTSLKKKYSNFSYINSDIRNKKLLSNVFRKNNFDLIIHAAAQPSHDWSNLNPELDFSINAFGTLILLELFRKFSSEGVFVFISTNKVYGDLVNKLNVQEFNTRYDFPTENKFYRGINELCSVDNSIHSIFGASKLSADILVQEYGKNFGLKTGLFRCGCLTGPNHKGAKLHGFLSYLVKSAINNETYTVIGYKGKQVRDNLHVSDLITAVDYYFRSPKKGEVYNMGGGRESNISIIEAISKVETLLGRKVKVNFLKTPRLGDHIWYITDNTKYKLQYPNWKMKKSIDKILTELVEKNK